MAEKTPEHSGLEQDIERLTMEIKERGTAEKGKEAVQEIVKEEVGSAMPPAQGSAPADSRAGQSSSLPNYLNKESAEVKLQVEKLLEKALHHGLKKAADEARKMTPLVMDAFHDALTDKLYEELKQRSLLK